MSSNCALSASALVLACNCREELNNQNFYGTDNNNVTYLSPDNNILFIISCYSYFLAGKWCVDLTSEVMYFVTTIRVELDGVLWLSI